MTEMPLAEHNNVVEALPSDQPMKSSAKPLCHGNVAMSVDTNAHDRSRRMKTRYLPHPDADQIAGAFQPQASVS
jgi:hypothetical protein